MCHACAEHILHINLFPNMLKIIVLIIIMTNIHGVFANFWVLLLNHFFVVSHEILTIILRDALITPHFTDVETEK